MSGCRAKRIGSWAVTPGVVASAMKTATSKVGRAVRRFMEARWVEGTEIMGTHHFTAEDRPGATIPVVWRGMNSGGGEAAQMQERYTTARDIPAAGSGANGRGATPRWHLAGTSARAQAGSNIGYIRSS